MRFLRVEWHFQEDLDKLTLALRSGALASPHENNPAASEEIVRIVI
jgi:hypothetical protein